MKLLTNELLKQLQAQDPYHPAVQLVFSFIIPFGYCAFYPAVYFTEPARWTGWLLAGPLVAAATLTVGILQFNRGIRVYESTGS